VKKKEKDKHQSYLMVVDEEDNDIGMRMRIIKNER
jgi:hypothetical protein